MRDESGMLIGICRPVPDVLSFVTPIFRDRAGAFVAQVVRAGRIASFKQVDLGEEFVPLKSVASASIGDPALYAMEFEDCIAVGPLKTVTKGSLDAAVWEDANVIRAAFKRNRGERSSGVLTFWRAPSVPDQFEAEPDDEAPQNQGRKEVKGRALDTEESDSAMLSTQNIRNRRVVSWFRRWRKPIRTWLSHRASSDSVDLDDLAQEVFLRLLRYSEDVAIDNPQGYLFRIATKVADDWQERSRCRPSHGTSWVEESKIGPTEEMQNQDPKAQLNLSFEATVDRLPSRQREILLLHVNDGLTYKQIADLYGLTYRIVLRDLTRAYSALREELRSSDTSPGADVASDHRLSKS
jgi:RNA polymerase sigma factor (sigma-70 family)